MQTSPAVDEAAVFATIRENLRAVQNEDIDAVMATVHPEMPDREASKELIQEIFAKYDLQFELLNLKVISATNDEVKVSFSQKTQRVGGAEDLEDNVVEGVHTLKKDGAKWKLLRSATLHRTSVKPR